MAFLYLAALAVALTGMVMLDRRFRLFFWATPWRALIVLLAGLGLFLAWDIAGVGLGVFFRGETSFMTGLQVAPEVPVEEVFFLTLLCYLTMNVYGAASGWTQGSPPAKVARARKGSTAADSFDGGETAGTRA